MPILANVIEDAFSPLISVFESIMVFIHNHLVGGSWGLAIVGLTVLIRAVLVPLTFKQLKSMQEMQRHMPELQAIKERYKDDKQRQQQEIMKFYQENGINPFASCLPLLLQLPVFISLFYMLRTDLKKQICGPALHAHGYITNAQIEKHACNEVAPHSAKFLFIPDITAKATGIVLVVLIVVYVGSQLASTLIATATTDPNQRRLLLVLPIIFVIILYRYPAGLLVYWITTNLWTIGQQFLIRRRMGTGPPPPPDDGSPNGKPRGRLKPLLAGGVAAPEAVAAGAGGKTGSGKAGAAEKEPKGKGDSAPTRTSAPPPPPRKKKKRSGRRR
jgi:YidC/Oxa1 family membrane protein insertase